jgi:hypothetical protein
MTSIDIEVLFSASKTINPSVGVVKMGKYVITTIPTIKESIADTKETWMLKFKDVWKDEQMHSNPVREAEYILSFLSVLCESKMEYLAIKSNGVQSEIRQQYSTYLAGKIEAFPLIEEALQKMNSMDTDILRQFLRSCSSYRTALTLIDDNPSLSFFLLATAVEAISGKIIKKNLKENFSEFILRYLPTSFKDEVGNIVLLESLIDEAYKMRCAFTHGGANISNASLSADQTNRIYIKHFVNEKETFSPSLRWFERVVRAVLISYLAEQDNTEKNEARLSDLAKEENVLYLRVARDGLLPGRLVTTNDLDLDAKG